MKLCTTRSICMKRDPFTSTVVSAVSSFSSSASSSWMRSKCIAPAPKARDGFPAQLTQREQPIDPGTRGQADLRVHRRRRRLAELAHVAQHQHLLAGCCASTASAAFTESGLAL
jgi:hypothetical protein